MQSFFFFFLLPSGSFRQLYLQTFAWTKTELWVWSRGCRLGCTQSLASRGGAALYPTLDCSGLLCSMCKMTEWLFSASLPSDLSVQFWISQWEYWIWIGGWVQTLEADLHLFGGTSGQCIQHLYCCPRGWFLEGSWVITALLRFPVVSALTQTKANAMPAKALTIHPSFF